MVRITANIHPVAGESLPASGRNKAALPAMLVILAGMLGGCAAIQDQTQVGSVPVDYRTRHPIVVHESEISQDIIVSANTRVLTLRDTELVRAFANKFRRSGAAQMAILIPKGSPNALAAKHLAYQATGVLRQNGVPEKNIRIMHYAAGELGDAATLRLAFGATVAEVESVCGQWLEDLTNTVQNENYYNFGCATQKNLAAMVANPADLVGPRAESEIDATRRTNVITDWQENGSRPVPRLF